MTNLEMRRGDLKPDLVIDLTDDNGPIPLSTATTVNVVARQNGALLFKRSVPLEDGVATMEWQVSDTDIAGTILVEVEIVWPGVKPQTVRPDNLVKVLPDLG